MIELRSDRQALIRFAVCFAIVATVLWSATIVLDYNFDSPAASRLADVLGYAHLLLNFGGSFVTFLTQLVVSFPFDAHFGALALPDVIAWAWILATVLFGAFLQGLVYGFIGLAGFRWCRQRSHRPANLTVDASGPTNEKGA